MATKKESVDINNTINVIQTVELLICYFAFCVFFFCNWLGHGIVDTLKSIVMIIPNLVMSVPRAVINVYQVLTDSTDVLGNPVRWELGTTLLALVVVLNVIGFIVARIHKE